MSKSESSPTLFWTSRKIQLFCLAVLALLGAHIVSVYISDTARTSLLKRGDFPSFYSAGMIVRQKLAAQLYDTKLLAYVQNLYWPSLRGNYISFPYPPFVASVLAFFALFPPYFSKSLFTVTAAAALAGAVYLTRPRAQVFRAPLLVLFTFFLAFFPVSFGILGSQFSALNMLLYAAILAGISQGNSKGEFWAGLAAGLWLFKPQYGLFFVWLLALARFWRAVAAAVLVSVFYFAIGFIVQGPYWISIWLSAAAKAASIDFTFNHFNMVSLSGFFYSLQQLFTADSPGWKICQSAGILLPLFLAGGLSVLFFNAGRDKLRTVRVPQILNLFALAAPIVLLISPHALFYDLGILIIACAPYAKLEGDVKITGFIALTAAASFFAAFRNQLPFQPLVLLCAAAAGFLWCRIKQIRGHL